MTEFFDTVDQVLAAAPEVVERVFSDFDKQRTQGDEKRNPVDFFTPLIPKVVQSNSLIGNGCVKRQGRNCGLVVSCVPAYAFTVRRRRASSRRASSPKSSV